MGDWLGPDAWTALRLSLLVAATATLASLPPGVAVAYALARWRFPGRGLLDTVVHLPLVLPPVVTGYLLLLTFGRRGLVGGWLAQHLGIVLSFRWTGAALACAVMGFPLMVRAIRLSLESVDPKLEQAAGTLGAGPAAVFAVVTLPLVSPGILAGMVLSFARSMGEFGATVTFVGNIPGETQTLPTAINTLIQAGGEDSDALKLTFVAVAVSMLALVLSEVLARRVSRRLAA